MRILRRVLVTLLLVIGLAIGGFIAWANTPAKPSAEAYAAMKSNDEVKVSLDAAGRLLFEPIGVQNGIGFILYPGGRASLCLELPGESSHVRKRCSKEDRSNLRYGLPPSGQCPRRSSLMETKL